MRKRRQFIVIASIVAFFATGVFFARAAFKSSFPSQTYVESSESNPSVSGTAVIEGNIGSMSSPTIESSISIENKESEPFAAPQSAPVIIFNTAVSQPFASGIVVESAESESFSSGGAVLVGVNTGDAAQSEITVESAESESASFLSFLLFKPNLPPDKPVNQSPGNPLDPPLDASKCEKLAILNPSLSASVFSDPNVGDTHAATDWELRKDGNAYVAPFAFESRDNAVNLTSVSVAPNLDHGTRYFWHVRYKDQKNLWSSWSDEWCFTTPLSPPQNVVGVPQNDTALPNPYTVLWSWSAVQNADTYIIELQDLRPDSTGDTCTPDGSFCSSLDYVISGGATTYRMDKDYEGKLLSSNSLYTIRVTAMDSGGKFINSNYSANASVGLQVQCPNNGRECRIGEVCFDHDKDGGAVTPMICTNFDKCATQGVAPAGQTCYISACPSGIVQPDGSCYNASPAERIFNDPDSEGVCVDKASVYQCDLLPVKPKNPEICQSDGVTGCQSGASIIGVPYQPRLKWKNGDPAESFNDYRGVTLSYPGENMQYIVTIRETTPSLPEQYYTPSNSVDLALGSGTDRFLNLNNLLSGPSFLDFNAAYVWVLQVQNSAGISQKLSPIWTFTTKSICPYIVHDYAPPMYKDQTFYPPPSNNTDNPNVMYPLDARLQWKFDSSLPSGAVQGPGAGDKSTFVLHVQESSDGGTTWDPFSGFGTNCGLWGCVDLGTATEYRFGGASDNCVLDPSTCLKTDMAYKWYLKVTHGHTPSAPIATDCSADNVAHDMDVHYFISETTPSIILSKKLVSLRDSELTYQIDFSFNGAPWARIKNVQVRDNYPDSAATAFFDTENTALTDDVLTAKEPSTLKVVRFCRASSGNQDTAIIWGIGDSADPQCASVNPDCTVPTNCSVSARSRGSLILVMNEQTADPVPQCTVLTNQATARGEALSGKIITATSNGVSHLAGSDQSDLGFLATERGDIHSNADICFKNAPLGSFYVGDYFVTAKGVVDLPRSPRAQEQFGSQYVISNNPILELDRNPASPDFAKIDYTDVYALAQSGGNERRGECSASQLFGPVSVEAVPIALGGKVFSCRSGVAGAFDYNGDGNAANGDFVVDREMVIDKDGGSGTIVIDGNLYINADISYESGAPASLKQLAALGWIVRGSVYIKEYRIDSVSDCTNVSADPRPKKWCDEYQVLQSLDNGLDGLPNTADDIYALKYPVITLGPDAIAGTFFAEQKIFTGKINNPLTIQGSLIADEVVLERRAVEDGGGSAPLPSGGTIDANNRFAYGELAGWVDMKPTGGGVYVYNDRLEGFAYGELLGWISMKPPGGGVINNGSGVLSGYAYSDLGGWIRFDPPAVGVIINPSNGEFSGDAYGELIGWIRFKGSGYGVSTTWRGQ